MSISQWVDDTLTLSKKEVPVKIGYIRQSDLRFFPENPRVYSIVGADEKEASQVVIEKRLSAMDHVKQLFQSIRANGGLTDALIVRDGDNVVLEGNSRLAAYRLLAKLDAIKWGKVKCKVLPSDISQDMVFALLGEYHIIGKKDWAPYEQAGYLYRRHKKYEVPISQMASEVGLSSTAISFLIRVYEFMVEHKDNEVTRWSYYEEYLKHNAIKKARENFPTMDQVVVEKIKCGEIPRAVDVRDKLSTIAKAGDKILRPFVTKKSTFEKCYDRAVARGVHNVWWQRLKRFRSQITDPDADGDFVQMTETLRKRCAFELKKIQQGIERILKKLS